MMGVVRTRFQSMIALSEVSEFNEELRRIFRELDRVSGDHPAGECSPQIDVRETDDAIEVIVDVPGVAADSLRVVAKGSLILVAGEKRPRRGRGDSSFHLIERDFGRFARAVRLPTACDTSRAQAVLSDGELRLSFPRVPDRRGKPIEIAVTQGS